MQVTWVTLVVERLTALESVSTGLKMFCHFLFMRFWESNLSSSSLFDLRCITGMIIILPWLCPGVLEEVQVRLHIHSSWRDKCSPPEMCLRLSTQLKKEYFKMDSSIFFLIQQQLKHPPNLYLAYCPFNNNCIINMN